MLPETLLCLLSSALALAQTRQELVLNTVSSFSPSDLPALPVFFSLPKSNNLTITIALCSPGGSPRFFVTNSSGVDNPGPEGGKDVHEIALDAGYGRFTGLFQAEGVLAVQDIGQTSFELGLSDQGPIHDFLEDIPLLGDTTSNQALLFSPPFSPPPYSAPSYPNYTLPPAGGYIPSSPSNVPNFTLVLSATSSSSSSIYKTGCSLSSRDFDGTITNQSLWLRDQQGWRTQWLVEALTPSTNYTAHVVVDGTKVSGPVYLVTKSAAFACPLVFNLPYCPRVGYTVPLPPPPPTGGSSNVYTADNVPDRVAATLLSYLANFTVTLTTFACGRDWYSPVVGCDDCEREYRRWLCALTFTRCGEPSPADLNSYDDFGSDAASPSAAGGKINGNAAGRQGVLSALVPQSTDITTARSGTLPAMGSGYRMLLPCLETCTGMDRACPSLLGIRCPRGRFNAGASYGVGYVDGGEGEDGEGRGVTGVAQDRWGNVWCNAG